MSKHQALLNGFRGGGSDTDIRASINPGRWALLIGIDRYPNFGSQWQLKGCVNDVLIMKDLLVKKFGFHDSQVAILIDEQATREGILAAMEALLRRVRMGDNVVFHYSGHGAGVHAEFGHNEAGSLGQAIVPHDSCRAPHASRDIKGSEIYLWVRRLADLVVFVTLILDCCHPLMVLRDDSHSELQPDWPTANLAERSMPMENTVVLIAACHSDEKAHEILVGKRIVHGALTFSLVRTLYDSESSGGTWQEVWDNLAALLNHWRPMQSPCIEGAWDRQVFEGREVHLAPFASVQGREDNMVLLNVGAASGVEVGSRWGVFDGNICSVSDDENFSGYVEVTEVGVVSSGARIVEEKKPGQVRAGFLATETCRALKNAVPPEVRAGRTGGGGVCAPLQIFELSEAEDDYPNGEVRLSLHIVAPAESLQAKLLAQYINRSRFLRMVGPEDHAGARIYLMTPRTCALPKDPVVRLSPLLEDTWVIVGADGHLLIPPFPCHHPEVLARVVHNLETVACLRRIVEIQNSDISLAGQIDFLLQSLESEHSVAPVMEIDGEPVFQEGDQLILTIRNRSRIPLYIYILHISLTGRSKQIFPLLGTHKLLEHNRWIELGRREREELRLFIPEDLLLLHKKFDERAFQGREIFKLFATSVPANLMPIHQQGLSFPSKSSSTGLRSRDIKASDLKTREHWITIQRTFLVRARPSAGSHA